MDNPIRGDPADFLTAMEQFTIDFSIVDGDPVTEWLLTPLVTKW
jgi:hypothetical protein